MSEKTEAVAVAMEVERNSDCCADRCSSNGTIHCSDGSYNYPPLPPFGGGEEGVELHSTPPALDGGGVRANLPPSEQGRVDVDVGERGRRTLRDTFGMMPELLNSGGKKGSEVIEWIADTGQTDFEAARGRFGVLRRMGIVIFDADTKRWVGCNAHKSQSLKEKAVVARVSKVARNASRGAIAGVEGALNDISATLQQIVARLERIEAALADAKKGGAELPAPHKLQDAFDQFSQYF